MTWPFHSSYYCYTLISISIFNRLIAAVIFLHNSYGSLSVSYTTNSSTFHSFTQLIHSDNSFFIVARNCVQLSTIQRLQGEIQFLERNQIKLIQKNNKIQNKIINFSIDLNHVVHYSN